MDWGQYKKWLYLWMLFASVIAFILSFSVNNIVNMGISLILYSIWLIAYIQLVEGD